jgi:hypothetical protein
MFGSFGGLALAAPVAVADGPPVHDDPVAALRACLDGDHQALVTNAVRRGVPISWDTISPDCRRSLG